jgi:hypothetical protein
VERDVEWYEAAAEQENEHVRVVIFKPGHPERPEALEVATRARDMAGRALGTDHPAYAEATQNLGLYYAALGGDPGKAAGFFAEARGTVGPYHPVLSRSFYFLGLHYLEAGDPVQSGQFFQEALDIIRREGFPDDPRVETILAKLAELG